MTRGMRRIVSVLKGCALLSCGHWTLARADAHWQVGRGFGWCPVCAGKRD